MTGPDRRLAALEALRAAVADGRVENRSREWYRLRDQARALDPEWVAQRNKYQAERRAARKAGQPLPQRVSVRSAMAERKRKDREAKRFQCVQKSEHMVKLQAADRERVERVAREIKATTAGCSNYRTDRGWRVRCFHDNPAHEGPCIFRRTA